MKITRHENCMSASMQSAMQTKIYKPLIEEVIPAIDMSYKKFKEKFKLVNRKQIDLSGDIEHPSKKWHKLLKAAIKKHAKLKKKKIRVAMHPGHKPSSKTDPKYPVWKASRVKHKKSWAKAKVHQSKMAVAKSKIRMLKLTIHQNELNQQIQFHVNSHEQSMLTQQLLSSQHLQIKLHGIQIMIGQLLCTPHRKVAIDVMKMIESHLAEFHKVLPARFLASLTDFRIELIKEDSVCEVSSKAKCRVLNTLNEITPDIQSIRFNTMKLTAENTGDLTELLSRTTSLKHLELASARCGAASLATLLPVIKELKYLVSLDLRNNCLNDNLCLELLNLLNLPKLTSISLDGNPISPDILQMFNLVMMIATCEQKKPPVDVFTAHLKRYFYGYSLLSINKDQVSAEDLESLHNQQHGDALAAATAAFATMPCRMLNKSMQQVDTEEDQLSSDSPGLWV